MQQAHCIGKMRGEGIIERFVTFSRRCFFVLIFFLNLTIRKKHRLRLVEIELFVHFRPHFANTFSVTCNATKTRADKEISGFLNLEET